MLDIVSINNESCGVDQIHQTGDINTDLPPILRSLMIKLDKKLSR